MINIQKMKKGKGYYIVVTDEGEDGGQFLSVTEEELIELQRVLNKKFKC